MRLVRPFVVVVGGLLVALGAQEQQARQLFPDATLKTIEAPARDFQEVLAGHPHFAWAAYWVEHYDQNTIGTETETLPLEAFEPMVHRFFARPPAPFPVG